MEDNGDEKELPNSAPHDMKQTDMQNSKSQELKDLATPILALKRVINLVIFPKGYPEERLTKELFDALYSNLMTEILNTEFGISHLPVFYSFTYRSECDLAQVICVNHHSADWLRSEITKLNPWSGPELAILEVEDSPKYKIITLYLPNGDMFSDKDLKNMLKKQNQTRLDVDLWQLISKEDFPGHSVVKFWITEDMAMVLSKFGNYLYFGLGRASFKIINVKLDDKLLEGEVAKTSTGNGVSE